MFKPGDVVGKWSVLEGYKPGSRRERTKSSYECRCWCGTERWVDAGNLRAGKSTNCGCFKPNLSIRLRPYEAVFNRLKRDAKSNGRVVRLTYVDFLKFTEIKECHYCGAAINWQKFRGPKTKWRAPYSLDRKDNNGDYETSNVVVCCPLCNFTKTSRFTYEEFMILSHGLRLVQYLRHPVSREEMNFMHTFSGKMFRYLDPSPEDVCIEDIAHALSQLNRFVGQTTKPYSVAQHSVLVSQTCPSKFALYGLLHDASEAYTNDVCRVLKISPGMGIYKWYENLAMSAVCKKFELPVTEPPEVKTADLMLLLTEKRDLFKHTCLWAVNKYDGTSHLEPLKKKIRPWTPEEAEEKFLERFAELKKTQK
jgi:5'-deoxynucleotidase YfbR-like HD superfamily hydrolase